jgi:hypothetical protein
MSKIGMMTLTHRIPIPGGIFPSLEAGVQNE